MAPQLDDGAPQSMHQGTPPVTAELHAHVTAEGSVAGPRVASRERHEREWCEPPLTCRVRKAMPSTTASACPNI